MNAVTIVIRCCDLFTVGKGISPRTQRVSVVMNGLDAETCGALKVSIG